MLPLLLQDCKIQKDVFGNIGRPRETDMLSALRNLISDVSFNIKLNDDNVTLPKMTSDNR